MGNIILVRHGQASFGASNYDQLSPLGFEQSRVLGEHLHPRLPNVDVVWMGALRRHRETAETCLASMGQSHTPLVDAGFDEYAFEAIIQRYTPRYADRTLMRTELAQSGDPKRAFQQLFSAAIERWTGGQHDDDYEESWPAFHGRCTAALHRLVATLGPSKTALVFTSGGVISVIVQHLLGLTAAQAFAFNWNIANASLTKLRYGGRGVSLLTFNEHGHFEQERRLVSFR